MTDLGTMSGTTYSYALSINDSGQAVGNSSIPYPDVSHAVLFSNGTVTDLGDLPGATSSWANCINNSGQAVGFSGSHAALFDINHPGTVTDLNSLVNATTGWTLEKATAINDVGQIVGVGSINGQSHAFLLTPAPVPVPSAVWLLGSGLLGLAGFKKKLKK